MNKQLTIAPIGGMGKVTQNMFLYQYENEILIVDCGIGFPDEHMPGVDTLIPDTSYLHEQLAKGKKIVGMVITHGHEDHMGAVSYILPELEEQPEFPIYGSPLTIGFINKKLQDSSKGGGQKGGQRRKRHRKDNTVEVSPLLNVLKDLQKKKIGQHFEVMSLAVTHSVPDTKHIAIWTPQGLVYHGSDFKLDTAPVDGVKTDLATMKKLGEEGIVFGTIDCLRSEWLDKTQSESTTGPVLEKLMEETKGKYIVTLMSSHIHRIQQVVDAAERLNRKVVFIGRSVEQNVEISLQLGKLIIPDGMLIDKRKIENYRDNELVVVIAGSQGQEGSSLIRAVYGEHRQIQILPNDKVIFSANVIPGNEVPYYRAINELSRNRVEVIYPDTYKGLHQSGHASAPEQREVLDLIKPKYIMPVGGEDRHRVKFLEYVAEPAGYNDQTTLIPEDGEILGLINGQVKVIDHISIKPRAVDGLGIGDVGPKVLSDRRSLSQAGMIVLVLPKVKGRLDLSKMEVVSRGFVFMQEADDVIEFIKQQTAEIIESLGKNKRKDEQTLIRTLERRLARKLYKVIRREPVILPVILPV